jgi:uncharacterized repeat protein (TIGR03837 family)
MGPMPHLAPSLRWDIFCRVIDNLGDVGVCWRLSRELAARGQRVRLWLDQTEALHWMAPGALQGQWPGIEVRPWAQAEQAEACAALPRGDVWVEAFGCEPPEGWVVAQRALWGEGQAPVWVNLEYLSAEPYVARMHRLPSPLMSGPARGWTRWFFYPGFTTATGGLLREAEAMQGLAAFDRQAWRQGERPEAAARACWVSLFCYEPPALPWLLERLWADADTALLVTPGRAAAAVQHWVGQWVGRADGQWPRHWVAREAVDQQAFDHLLWACDLNAVRGEDSLVRALWAGQAFVWQIYPQHDGAHHDKLRAFLDWLDPPPDWRDLQLFWNGVGGRPPPDLAPARLTDWREAALQARARLWAQPDLATQLLGFVMEKR